MQDKILLLNQMLVQSSMNNDESNDNYTTELLQVILSEMSKDYTSYRGAIAYLIDICENNKDKSMVFLLHLYITSFELTFESKEFAEITTPQVDLEKINIKSVLNKLNSQLKEKVKKIKIKSFVY